MFGMTDEISIIQALILGAVQGVVEWLPISSEGITMFLMINSFGKNPSDAISYAIFLHFGTMLAAILKFKDDFSHILASFSLKNWRKNWRENSMLSIILIATLFTGLTAVPLTSQSSMEASQSAVRSFPCSSVLCSYSRASFSVFPKEGKEAKEVRERAKAVSVKEAGAARAKHIGKRKS